MWVLLFDDKGGLLAKAKNPKRMEIRATQGGETVKGPLDIVFTGGKLTVVGGKPGDSAIQIIGSGDQPWLTLLEGGHDLEP